MAGSWLMDACAGVLGLTRVGEQNPAIGASLDEVRAEMRRMREHPVTLARPVLVLGAYHAWGPVTWALAEKIRRLTGAGRGEVVAVPFLFETSLQGAAVKGVKAAAEAWGHGREIDIAGISMGGLVARMAVSSERGSLGLPGDLPRVSASRIFTFGSPLRGAKMALRARPDRAARDMRPGSAVLSVLGGDGDGAPELICYGQARDAMVGLARTAPEGMEPIWSNGTWVFSHFATPHNPWFIVDMARRLRGEEPLLRAGGALPRE